MKNIYSLLLITGLLLASTLAFPNIPGFSAINNDERDILDGLDDDDPFPPIRPKLERKNAIDFSKIDLDELLGENTKEEMEEKNILDGLTPEATATLQAFIGSIKHALDQGKQQDFDDGMIDIEKTKNTFVPHTIDADEERMEGSGKKNFDEIFEKVIAGLEMNEKVEERQKDFDFDPFEPEL